MEASISKWRQSADPRASGDRHVRKLTAIALMYFVWGFLTSLNNALTPFLQSAFSLDYLRSMMVQTSFFGAALLFAMPSAKLVEKLGHKSVIVMGLSVMAIGSALFIPASFVVSFDFFLSALIVISAGITALQVAAGPYVTRLGAPREAASRVNLMLGLNSLGAMVALPFGGAFILRSHSRLAIASKAGELIGSITNLATVQLATAYAGIAFGLGALAALVALVRLPQLIMTNLPRGGPAGNYPLPKNARRHVLKCAAVMFLYVGAEVTIGSFMINFLHDPAIGGMTRERATLYVSLYWGGSMVGRLAGWSLLQKIETQRTLAVASLLALVLVMTAIVGSGCIAASTIIAVGLFNSIMVSCIFTMAVAGLGPFMERGAGIMVAAVAGGAAIPAIQGAFADRFGIHPSFVVPALCYLCISAFGFSFRPFCVPSDAVYARASDGC